MSTELKEKLLPTQESAPRTGDGIDYSMFYDPYAMIIIFPNVEGFEEEYEKEIEKDDLSEMLHDIFNKKTSEEFAHDCETEYPYTYRLYHAADDGPANQGILIDLARKSFIEIIYKRCGLVTYSYYSRDKDEILVKVMGGGENDHNLLVFAEQFKYNLQLKSDLDPRPEWADKPSAWTSFDDDKKDLFAHYDGRYGSRSPLRQKDRIKLTLDAIKEFIDIDFLAKRSGFAKEYYPLHDQQELKDLRDNWGRLGLWYSLYQPIEDIKNYFGEKVAMYFAWLGHYATWLAAPALIGLAVFISGLFMDADGDKPAKLYILICAAFAGVMAIWSSVFHEFWKRKESTYAVYWGTTNCEEVEPPRPDFQGVRQENPVTERFERYYDPKKRAMKLIVSLFGAACVVGLVIGTVMLLMNLKYGSSNPNIQMAAGILNSVQIKVFNIVYGILAVKMNDWENHRTETEYEDNLVLKIFLFQFINSYISFFYVAFVYPIVNADHCESKESTASALNFFGMAADTDNHDDTDGNTGGPHISCDFMGALAMQLGTVFIINVGMNAVELGLPFFMTWLEKKREEAALKDAKNVTRTFLFPSEEQSKLAGYEGTMGDYLEMAIQFGYVTMFCVGFPLVPTLAFFNNMLEIRIDAFKLCNLQQRPVPALAKDIGTWGGIIGVIATIAVVSNIGLVLFTANLLEGRAMWLKLAIFIILEHIVFIIKAIIAEGIADTPEDTEDLHARHDIIIKREYYGFSEENEEQLNQKLTKIAAVYDVDDDDLKDCKKLE